MRARSFALTPGVKYRGEERKDGTVSDDSEVRIKGYGFMGDLRMSLSASDSGPDSTKYLVGLVLGVLLRRLGCSYLAHHDPVLFSACDRGKPFVQVELAGVVSVFDRETDLGSAVPPGF